MATIPLHYAYSVGKHYFLLTNCRKRWNDISYQTGEANWVKLSNLFKLDKKEMDIPRQKRRDIRGIWCHRHIPYMYLHPEPWKC